MLEQYLYFWQLFKVNELKNRDKYDRIIFNYHRAISLASESYRFQGPAVSRGQINCRDTALPSPDFGNINNSDVTGFDPKHSKDTAVPFPYPEKPYISAAIYLLLLSGYLWLVPASAIAQIVPDNTLGPESSRAVPDTVNNLPSDRISGGATRGSNLFHSFREFNINEGRAAYFENPSGISNIFTRVTGSNRSNILGTLGVLGNGNLFLINPKGIVFGPNARLDLRGAFIGSTADSIVFNNGFEFSSTNPQTLPLLTVNIPVGLRFRDNPGTIVNQSTASGKVNLPASPVPVPISDRVGLAVDPGQTLALIGGEIQ
ncbi:filamentous hemagglutinin N-terminal domain-containing protein, partial [Microcoleus sp. herbarium19]|uniref:filamentous hemagglutinin N-terminal domain-containing protein n=1 Tax=Microcoleus sp. herbarium19 TaxID=3055440 RepID=UPI002FD66656